MPIELVFARQERPAGLSTLEQVRALQEQAQQAATTATDAQAAIEEMGIQGAYLSRADAEAAMVPAGMRKIVVGSLAYRRDPAGAALVTGDGAHWSPDGEWTDLHFVGPDMTISERTAALQAWCGPTAPKTIILRGEHQIAGTLDLTNSSVTEVKAEPGGGLIRTTDEPIWRLLGSRPAGTTTQLISSTVPIGARGVNINTPGDFFAVGDWVMLRCNDLTPGVTNGSRVGMIRKVTAIGGAVLYLDAAVYRTMSSGPSVYKIALARSVEFIGGRYESIDQSGKSTLFHIFLARDPIFTGVRYGNSGGPGITLVNCVGGVWQACHVYNLRDESTIGHVGYGVALAGACRGFQFLSGRAERVRHAITTGTVTTGVVPAEYESIMGGRGEPENCYYGPVYCHDTTEAALDAHEQGHNIRMVPNVHGCFSAINLRCNEAFVDGGIINDCRRMGIKVLPPASNPTTTGTQKLTITGTVIDGVALDGTGGAESYGLYIARPGAEVFVQNIRISGYRGIGAYVADGATLLMQGGMIDGGGIAGTTGVQLEGSGSVVKGTIIRGNTTNVSQAAGATNDIT